MRFALWLLLVMAVGSVVGVIVSDQYPIDRMNWEQLAEKKAGPALFPILKFFGMFDPFRSWWFRGLVVLLTLALLACAIKRARGVWRRALFASWIEQARFFDRYDNRATFDCKGDDPFAMIAAPLRRTLYRVERRSGPGDALLLAANRGGPARFGPFLSHAGLLFLLVGGLVTTVFGLKTMLWLAPGESSDTLTVGETGEREHPLPFTIAVDDFNVELNAQGMVRQYRSDLTVTPRHGAPFKQQIAVNHPLRFGGYNFYQASYQPARDRVKSLTAAVHDTSGHELSPPREVRFGERLPLGGGFAAEAIRYLPDARVGPDGLQNVSPDPNNPAFLFRILQDGQQVGTQWVFTRFPDMVMGDWTERRLAVQDFEPAYATGLEVTRAPFTGLIWAGLLLSTIGLVLSFNVAHRQLWALAEPDGKGGWRVHVAVFTNRASLLFGQDFRRWAEKWGADPGVRNLRVTTRADAKEKAA
ncbi:MAG: cytochrome c biogenesis protein ResB [Candidatus Krumholzibacteriia bacterium]